MPSCQGRQLSIVSIAATNKPSRPHPSLAAVLQQAAALPHDYAAWPLLALMALTVYAAFPPALAGAIEEDFGFMSVGELQAGSGLGLGSRPGWHDWVSLLVARHAIPGCGQTCHSLQGDSCACRW